MPRLIVSSLAALAVAVGVSTAAQAVRLPDGSGVNTSAEIIAKAPPGDWRPLDPAHTLYVELPAGRVVIELDPAYAPLHVANIETFAHEHYYDGLPVERSQDNYVVQWGDRDGKKPLGSAKPRLASEFTTPIAKTLPFTRLPDPDTYAPQTGFSAGFAVARDPAHNETWLVHCYGYVGVARDTDPMTGSGAELYVVNGQAPRHLDRNTVVVGRVVQGMELLADIPRSLAPLGFYEKPEEMTPVRAIRVATDVPPAERTNLEMMRTDSESFRKLIEARRNRSEAWFHRPANAVDVCNVPVPVRVAR
jgi:peptidylprolyl isomerase